MHLSRETVQFDGEIAVDLPIITEHRPLHAAIASISVRWFLSYTMGNTR